MKSKFVRGKPCIIVQQIGKPVRENDPLYTGCLELRGYLDGCDYHDRESDEPVSSIARRRADGRIFSVQDYRFCNKPEFEILWLHERRKSENKNVTS